MSSKTEEAKIVDDLVQAMYAFNLNISSTEQTQFLAEMEGKLTQALATYKVSVISECERENVVSVEIVKGYNEEKKILAEALKNVGDDDFHLQFELQTRLKTIDTTLQAINSLKV